MGFVRLRSTPLVLPGERGELSYSGNAKHQ